jgi:ketosteroid isomerase-like protein
MPVACCADRELMNNTSKGGHKRLIGEQDQTAGVLRVLAEYCHAIDACDRDRIEACFSPDAIFVTPDGRVTTGAASIADRLAANAHTGYLHLTCNAVITEGHRPEECESASAFVVIGSDGRVSLFGHYTDLLRLGASGNWEIASRSIEYDYRQAAS